MVVFNDIIFRIVQILLVPYFSRNTIWIIAPLIFSLVMLQMYFGKYKTEPLGWNTAFSNSISLMWVTAILLKYMHDVYGLLNIPRYVDETVYIILIFALAIFTLILIILNYNHLIPKKLAFLLSSSIPINISAYFIIVMVVGGVPIDLATVIAVIIIFLIIYLIFRVYRALITPAESAVPTIKKHEKQEKSHKYYQKRKFKEKIKEHKKKIKKLFKNH